MLLSLSGKAKCRAAPGQRQMHGPAIQTNAIRAALSMPHLWCWWCRLKDLCRWRQAGQQTGLGPQVADQLACMCRTHVIHADSKKNSCLRMLLQSGNDLHCMQKCKKLLT